MNLSRKVMGVPLSDAIMTLEAVVVIGGALMTVGWFWWRLKHQVHRKDDLVGNKYLIGAMSQASK